MKIMPVYVYNTKTQRSVSFSSTDRFYRTDAGKEIGNNTWMFREDLNWRAFADFQISHFKDKEKVNIIQFASSDGSEGYTQIISLLENSKRKDVSKFFPIQAYDIDDFIIAKVRSGEISLGDKDIARLRSNSIQRSKYFIRKPSEFMPDDIYKRILQINPDEIFGSMESFKVSDKLRDKIIFKQGDMFNLLPKIKDDSNTVLLCRNILGYFYEEPEKIEAFIKAASNVLKKGSVFAIGDLDTYLSNIEQILSKNSFLKMQNNVYIKV